jgi:hypothetical protein
MKTKEPKMAISALQGIATVPAAALGVSLTAVWVLHEFAVAGETPAFPFLLRVIKPEVFRLASDRHSKRQVAHIGLHRA